MNILVKFPTRGRPERALATLKLWRKTQSAPLDAARNRRAVRYLLTVDADDAPTIAAFKAVTDDDVAVHVCPPGGKIAACNAGVGRDGSLETGVGSGRRGGAGWDILVLASDDMLPVAPGWDAAIAANMARHFPNLDGALHFNDGYLGGDRLITLPIMGRNLYRRFGYIYHFDYKSLWCDNEFTDVMRALNKVHYDPRVIIRHVHAGRRPDAVFRHNQTFWDKDKATYLRRQASGFDLRRPTLSILIAALESRRPSLAALLANLNAQMFALADPQRVELHVLLDNRELPVGRKRNTLLERSRGRYVCFIDDDDQVAGDYCASILAAIDEYRGTDHGGRDARAPDCVVFNGLFTIDGKEGGPFDYAIGHGKYHQVSERAISANGTPALRTKYFRTPNHLCPVRRELAISVKFAEINRGEDTDYAKRLLPLLKSEAPVVDESGAKRTLYFYQFSPTGTETQRRRSADVPSAVVRA